MKEFLKNALLVITVAVCAFVVTYSLGAEESQPSQSSQTLIISGKSYQFKAHSNRRIDVEQNTKRSAQ
ncbi:hypothetical protein N7E81_03960 [Reichenbachiella carrageenanivorans]|uniref:Uncharacterized protein n=1 Tax=Reichenbachiella carrageenanivorans TaxID=2979869 RepID=A0ABY6D3A7_9BACT|nr:hypothetical protein [Reichenbachiella carrageenanivorans]UXX80254.1 hypothetical protein N7E81_03960 [Reichenbachiella carrageenanivorans]